jgi:hypothetical protein
MGIIHLAPVGRSPGAVTVPLAYLKRLYEEQQTVGKRLEKSILSPGLGNPVEAVVLFVSEDIRRGRKDATAYPDIVYNYYGRRESKQPVEHDTNVVDLIQTFVAREFRDNKLTLYARVVNVEDFKDCFEAIAETAIALGRPDDLGKTLWANITGGTNVLNAALLEVTFLSGLISRLYYIFAEGDERRFMQPWTDQRERFMEHWQDIPVMKTTFDDRYREILLTLVESSRSWDAEGLLGHLQQRLPERFAKITLDRFEKQWLRKMDRDLDVDERTRQMRISEVGLEMVDRMEDRLFLTLVQRGDDPLVDTNVLRDKLDSWRV